MTIVKTVGVAALSALVATPALAHMPGVSKGEEGGRNAPIAEALTELLDVRQRMHASRRTWKRFADWT